MARKFTAIGRDLIESGIKHCRNITDRTNGPKKFFKCLKKTGPLPPGFGDRKAMLEDIGILTGGKAIMSGPAESPALERLPDYETRPRRGANSSQLCY